MRKKILTMLLAGLIAGAGTAAGQAQTDVFKTASGKDVKITCIKHASFEISYEGKEFQIDPVGDGALPITDYDKFPKADYIIITHEHKDHFDREAIACLRKPSTLIYLNERCYREFHNGMAMSNGDSLNLGEDISLKAVPAYNTTPGREQFHPKGRDNGYLLTIDGLRIYIAGDTEDIPEMAELKDIDIAFLPCNQPYTMTIDQLVKAANTIKPKVLFPYHYSETPINQARMRLMGSGIDVRIRAYK